MLHLGKRSRTLLAAAAGAAVVLSLTSLPSQATPASVSAAEPAGSAVRGVDRESKGFYDARQVGQRARVRAERSRIESQTKAARSYQKSLGAQAVVDYDAVTATVRSLTRRDGYLSAPASGSARSIALSYVRGHLDTVGLTQDDLSTLSFRKEYVDPLGIRHVSWTQSVDGVEVFGNGLEVKVTRDGRVLSVQGAPVSGLRSLAADASTAAAVDAAEARTKAAADVGGKAASDARVTGTADGTTTWSNNDFAERVWFLTPTGLRSAWSTYVQAGDDLSYQHVVDAATGDVLFRRSTVNHEKGDAYVYDNYPGARRGGDPKVVNFIDKGWLGKNKTFLDGSSVVAWSDTTDDNVIGEGERTPVPGKKRPQFALKPFDDASERCSDRFVCTWDPNEAGSWATNRKADVTQAFYLASRFHDYLAKPPFLFTPAAGNFETAGGDPVLLNALDGAASAGNMPDGDHINNANMNTPPDGVPPTMQMYLFHVPGATDAEDEYVPASSAFDASVLYHEYTHGLSNRLVVDASGNSTLNSIQAGAMGEAWSDYYAMDHLVEKGFVKDTDRSGQVGVAEYLTARGQFRTMMTDCAVGTTARRCTAGDDTRGGYTYAEFPTVGGGPQVHASGEIWAQTLWDIRKEFGHELAGTLVTRAMSLAANDPSFLDMRDAILQVDMVAFGSDHTAKLWKIFANRGMGYYSGTVGSTDVAPGEDFETPPPAYTPRTAITGVVTDPATGDPVEGAVVHVTSSGSGYADVTNEDGEYFIGGLYEGTYAKVVASSAGYLPDAHAVDTSDEESMDFSIRRDWAASSGGATIDDFNGGDFTAYGCGPNEAIDLSLGTGWGSTTGDDAGTPTNVMVPKYIVVDMQQPIDIDTFEVDPNATCGDGASASTKDYRIETSVEGTVWTTAAEGTFTADDRGQLNVVTPTGATEGVRYVKFWILSNQTPDFATNCPDGAYSGCSYSDLTELAVFGAPTVEEVRP